MKTTLFAAALGLAFAPAVADAQPIRRGFPGVRGGFSDFGPVVNRRRPAVCPGHRRGLCDLGRCPYCRRPPVRDCWVPRRPPIRDCWVPRRPPIRDCWTPRGPIVRPRGPIFDRGVDCRNGTCDLDRGPIFRRNPRDLGPGVRVIPRSFGRDIQRRDIRRDVDREIRNRGRREHDTHDHGPRLLPPRP